MSIVKLGLLLGAAALLPIAYGRLSVDKPAPPASVTTAVAAVLEPVYSVQAGIDGEIFPALADYASLQKPRDRKLATISVHILNATRQVLKDRVSVEIPGWSDRETQMVAVAPGETRILNFAPSFLPRLFANREITSATALIVATDASGRRTYDATLAVRLRPAEDMYWGPQFKYAPFIAAWVTPHDAQVEDILSRAKEFMPGRRLPGYEPWKDPAAQVRSTFEQARAIYRTLQERGVSYVKSSTTFGQHLDISERVRFPRESLNQISANCIDGAVMYASLFENLGMDPVVVLIPGHAYVGVRESLHSATYLYIETAITGRATFETAVLSASRGLAKYRAEQIRRISIAQSRQQGIYPMPLAASSGQTSTRAAAPYHPAAE
ncbi:MAG: hypothetical protein LAO06_08520 [Acidobacteriia bacterium]|nr:hypothetical protein [Terriglobia bacterium]